MKKIFLVGAIVALGLVGCGEDPVGLDAGTDAAVDSGREVDSGPDEDGGRDGGPGDAGPGDAGPDGGPDDAGNDGGPGDAGTPCVEDADCDDSMACNGEETCVDSICAPGTPIDADGDGFSCDDCDDAVATTHPGATELCNGADDDCDLVADDGVSGTNYADCDGDGWARIDAPSSAGCEAPPPETTGCGTAAQAWTTREPTGADFDCGDEDARAHSTTVAYQTTAITTSEFTEFPFDFDCDSAEQQQYPAQGSCAPAGGCTYTAGWVLAAVPGCGESALFITGCAPTTCLPMTETRTQGCR